MATVSALWYTSLQYHHLPHQSELSLETTVPPSKAGPTGAAPKGTTSAKVILPALEETPPAKKPVRSRAGAAEPATGPTSRRAKSAASSENGAPAPTASIGTVGPHE